MMQDFVFSATDDAAKLTIRQYKDRHWWREVIYFFCDRFCKYTGHRLCNSLVIWAFELCLHNTEATMVIPVTREQWVAWTKLTGAEDPSWWWEEDLEAPIDDDEVRT